MKITREVSDKISIIARNLPIYDERAITNTTVKGEDYSLKDGIKYTGSKDTRRFIDEDRHIKRLRKAYKKYGDKGLEDYVNKHSNVKRTYFTLWGFIKYHLFRIKPKGLLSWR